MDNLDFTNGILAPGVIATLLYFLLKTYLGEKLKNVATEEDIGGITEAVESVKQAFTKETEELKQKLNVITNKHNVLFNEEKEGLFSFLGAWNVWYANLHRRVHYFKFSETETFNDIVAKIIELDEKDKDDEDKVEFSISRLELFLNNDDILKSINALYEKTFEFQNLNSVYINDFLMIRHSFNSVFNTIEENTKNNKSDASLDVLRRTLEEHRQTMLEKEKIYNANSGRIVNDIKTLRNDFLLLGKAYIRKGIE